MVRRTLLLAAAVLSFAASAVAWVPLFPVREVNIRTGEQIFVAVHAAWSGLDVTFTAYNWDFFSNDEEVALVQGHLQNPNPDGTISITGTGPGDTYVKIGRDGTYPWLRIHVDCMSEPGVIVARPVITAVQGQAVALQAIFPAPTVASFQWFSGRLGDSSHPITDAAGSELSLIAQTAGPNYVWVSVSSRCSTSIAEFRIDVAPLRRRSSGH